MLNIGRCYGTTVNGMKFVFLKSNDSNGVHLIGGDVDDITCLDCIPDQRDTTDQSGLQITACNVFVIIILITAI